MFVAGHSSAAIATAQKLGVRHMTILKSSSANAQEQGAVLHFGMFTRADSNDAWNAAYTLFPEDEEG